MAKAVLTAKLSPAYDDIPERQYHFFGRDYLRQIESAVGDFVVYYEPRRTTTEASSRGGRQAYYAVARLTGLRKDPENIGYFYADIGDYIDFDKPVPFRIGENYLEGALQREDGKTSKGAFGRSVRLLPELEFDAIVRAGFSDFSAPPKWAEPAEVAGFYEEQTPFERPMIEQVVARPFRDASFRAHVRSAYANRCAVTGLQLLNGGGRPEVQAAHIMPVSDNGPDSVRNGLALSGTVHWMFDRGLISVSEDLKLIAPRELVPPELQALVENGKRLLLPSNEIHHPHPAFLRHHRERVFKRA
jgi:putative restriction endonuclease